MKGTNMSEKIVNPANVARTLNAGKNVRAGVPTFTHTIVSRAGVTTRHECEVVVKCAQCQAYHVVAVVNEEGEYVRTTEYVGVDRTRDNGMYRICKACDKINQDAFRARQALKNVVIDDNAPVIDEA